MNRWDGSGVLWMYQRRLAAARRALIYLGWEQLGEKLLLVLY